MFFDCMKQIKITDYNDQYIESIRDLMLQLETYLVSIDQDHLEVVSPRYREEMILHDLAEVKEHAGAAFVALKDGRTIGFISGITRSYSDIDHLDYKCPKCGVITELIIDESTRGNGVGTALIQRMEHYFLSVGCETMIVDVFEYNETAKKFYAQCGYHPRMVSMIKKLNQNRDN